MDEEILVPSIEEEPWYNYYEIYNENDELITNPNLELGYLKLEDKIIYHEGIPEKGHYYVSYIELNTGESFFLQENDERIEFTNPEIGTFKFLPVEEDPAIKIKSATVRYIIDQEKIDAWEESYKILRYILYTENELANQKFLAEAPERFEMLENDTSDLFEVVADLAGSDIEERVADTQETVDDLLLVIADLLGGASE